MHPFMQSFGAFTVSLKQRSPEVSRLASSSIGATASPSPHSVLVRVPNQASDESPGVEVAIEAHGGGSGFRGCPLPSGRESPSAGHRGDVIRSLRLNEASRSISFDLVGGTRVQQMAGMAPAAGFEPAAN